ncbi:hypothetical protein RRG08_032200 [Elysia crispata]|uniref:Uncharacterized protein n=1 Tax=Elysia crispata TaxID=231223 RepID=A0AAE1ABX3_9GAST|nr:hypothetical protein RRG08_032200 [Elysia crispata]
MLPLNSVVHAMSMIVSRNKALCPDAAVGSPPLTPIKNSYPHQTPPGSTAALRSLGYPPSGDVRVDLFRAPPTSQMTVFIATSKDCQSHAGLHRTVNMNMIKKQTSK